jgi:tetratricopeptide (TPR) repeat protein
MTEGDPDADRARIVGVDVFELRAGIRARAALPPPPRLASRVRRTAGVAIKGLRLLFVRTRPAIRALGDRLFRRGLATVTALGRRIRVAGLRKSGALRRTDSHREDAKLPELSPTETNPEVADVDSEEPVLRQALLRLAAREHAFGSQHPNVATELHFIGALHHEAGRYDEALAYYGLALTIRERTLAADHPELASTLEDLAATREAQGEAAEAGQLLARAQHVRLAYRRLNGEIATAQ